MRVRLRKKRGRGWSYQEADIPTDAEMERIAAELHAAAVPALREVLGWKVFYLPSGRLRYSTTEVDLFTHARGETEERECHTTPHCVFGHGSDEWRVAYVWQPGQTAPRRIQEAWHGTRNRIGPDATHVSARARESSDPRQCRGDDGRDAVRSHSRSSLTKGRCAARSRAIDG